MYDRHIRFADPAVHVNVTMDVVHFIDLLNTEPAGGCDLRFGGVHRSGG